MKMTNFLFIALLLGSMQTLGAGALGTPPSMNTQQQTQLYKDGTKVVIATFDNRQDAGNRLGELLDYMDKKSSIVNLELKYGFDYAVGEKEGVFTVSIEPFGDEKVANEVLETVKIAYPNAKLAVCKECIKIKEELNVNDVSDEEAFENALAAQNEGSAIKMRVEEEVEEDLPTSSPVASSPDYMALIMANRDYIMYGAGGLAVLILIFLVMRKPKQSSKKELKELYIQAQELEKEMQSPESKPEVKEVVKKVLEPKIEVASVPEPEIKIEDIVIETTAEPEPVVVAPTPEPQKEVKPVAKVKTEVSSSTSHKLREPNKAVTAVNKDNFKEFEGMRLLIAEDNLINQKVIVGLLKDSGINIKIANDGQECLEILAEDSNYPIILMDAHMPRIDGLEATRQIRANPAYDHITVMALSGDTGADDIRKMRECGMEEQLEKPLKIAALYQALYCYFDPDAIDKDEEFEEIHLDNSLGLEMLGGDIELYNEILAEFATLYADSDKKLVVWLKEGDLDEAKRLLLDVKGIGESIGTPELTSTAEEFREAVINEDRANFDKYLKRYSTHLQSILADIAEV